nr:ferredoxin family protein [Candidatus Baldrarchaeota archaeon]
MNLIEALSNFLTIAFGVIAGTLLTWIISYFMAKRMLPKLLRSLSKNPEIINAIQMLKAKSNTECDHVKVENVNNDCGIAQIILDLNKCNGCLKCVETCSFGVFKAEAHEVTISNPQNCHLCLACEIQCPTKAIKIIEPSSNKNNVVNGTISCLSLSLTYAGIKTLISALPWILTALIILLIAIYLWYRKKISEEIISS